MQSNTQELKNFEFGNATDVGSVRTNNEDYMGYFPTPNGHLFVVCDGMGGHQAGETASQLAVATFKNFFAEPQNQSPQQALDQATQEANKVIFETAQKHPQYNGMGTTLVAVLIQNNQIFYAHVGDSRLYFYENETKTLHRVTKDHSFVQKLVESGVILDSEAETHPRKNEILKALGVKANVEPEVCNAPILPADHDLILLCSDGLNGMINDEIIKKIITESNVTIMNKTKNLIDEAKKAGGTDNITAQLIRFYAQNRQKAVLPTHTSPNASPTPQTSLPKTQKKASNKVIWIALATLLAVVVTFGIVYTQNKQKQDKITFQKDSLIKLLKENTKLQVKKDSLRQEDSLLNIKKQQNKQDSIRDNAKKTSKKVTNKQKITPNKPTSK